MVTASEVQRYLLANSPWVDPAVTVDTVKSGDPERRIGKAGVCWFADLGTMMAAHEAGCELLVVHEPIFWDHRADEPHWRALAPGITKQRFLDETGLVVLRAHDTWDQWPEIGIRDSWAAGLGLTKRVKESTEHGYHALYEIAPQPLRCFAQYIAEKIRPTGEDSVQAMGNPDRIVSHPALGVGCIGPDKEMVDAGADVVIVCYDGAPYWMVRERLFEQGAAVITVEHGTSEMWGIENLCRHLETVYPSVSWEHFAMHPRTWTVRPA
jgi:putative NIF3 family GTP cyclohydrolase 1 type 2